jgi:hypothetical protein
MNLAWRFYVDTHGAWRWQQIAVGGTAVSDSVDGHASYEECVADATSNGYKYAPSQPKLIMPPQFQRRN